MSMTSQARKDLLEALQPHVAAIAEDLRLRLLRPATPAEASAREAAAKLREEEGAGDDLDVWLDLFGHRAAVLWVLKLIYARVLEDRGLIRPRLIDPVYQQLFERLAPALGETAFLRWVFLDLAQASGGLPELFTPQAAELLAPADAHSRALLAALRATSPDTGARRFDFTGERFDGQLLGDLYQELDPVVKERYALLQTPDFVRAFILDRTLSEALKVWPADQVRLLDPACGSGHFLIDGLRRLTAATAAQHPSWPRRKVVESALSRVVGIDLNDYAAALARARLVMTALELSGEESLLVASSFHPQVFCADGLEQVEKGEDSTGTQGILFHDGAPFVRATLTPAGTRVKLQPVLAGGFHVVVANPPYIVERDEAKKKYHKDKLGKPKRARYISATGKYSLGSPFTERCFQLAVKDGFVGLINSNAFAKREFGVALVEEVLANEDLSLVVDTSGAYIPGHGTPTVLVFGRHRKPGAGPITAVLGKRGEPSNPEVPAEGKVWSAILEGWDKVDFDSPFVSTEAVPRKVLSTHPWSLRGGGALGLQRRLEETGPTLLKELFTDAGFASFAGADDVFLIPPDAQRRLEVPGPFCRAVISGEAVRDWAVQPKEWAIAPYDKMANLVPAEQLGAAKKHFWRFRTSVGATMGFGGKTRAESGEPHWSWYRWQTERIRLPNSITFAFVATHNHFVLDRGGKVFNRTAPVIKLPPEASEDDHFALLGPLNSSTACFWMKQVFFNKGVSTDSHGARVTGESWADAFEHDSTKLARFPLPPHREHTLPWASALDALGHARAADTVAESLADPGWTDPEGLRAVLMARRARDLARLRRMVGLQEELDWLVYRLYGLIPADSAVLAPEATPGIDPGLRPFELRLAASGDETAWFTRHGWAPQTALPADHPADAAALVAARLALIETSAPMRLLEAPVHKRRWYQPPYEADEKAGLRAWLLDRLEEALAARTAPTTPAALARALADEPRFAAAAQVYDSERVELADLCARLMALEAVAAHPLHRYTNKGLVKRRAWEKTWALQAEEDRLASAPGTGKAPKIPVPPAYTGADFVGSAAYPLRGKLDVPKERFVHHAEVPAADGRRRSGDAALYAWAGWTREQRLIRLFTLLEHLDDEGVPNEARLGLFDLMYRYVDELARTAPARAADLRADLTGEARHQPSEVQLTAWFKQYATPGRG